MLIDWIRRVWNSIFGISKPDIGGDVMASGNVITDSIKSKTNTTLKISSIGPLPAGIELNANAGGGAVNLVGASSKVNVGITTTVDANNAIFLKVAGSDMMKMDGKIDVSADMNINKRLILQSPNGSKFSITVDDNGNLSAASI